jgi:NTE family protein
LRDLGRRCAAQWLEKTLPDVGVVSSIHIAKDYLDDMRVPVHHEGSSPSSGFRPA